MRNLLEHCGAPGAHCSREHKLQGVKASTIQNIESKLDPRVLARHVEEGKPLAK
jgi:hypothetical protein